MEEITYHPYQQTLLYQIFNNPFVATILLIIYERKNPNSHWKELFELMPSMDDSILFWSETDLEILKDSSVNSFVIHKKNKKCTQIYLDCIVPIFQYHQDFFNPVNNFILF